jgi:hypothetical protein
MKSVVTSRVDTAAADRLYYESRALGNPATCPINARFPDLDEFGRSLGGGTYRLGKFNDSSCSSYIYTPTLLIAQENNDRPILGPCAPGTRGAADFLGVNRDRTPHNLYGEGNRGNFKTGLNTMKPAEGTPSYTNSYLGNTARPLTLSMDAITNPYIG